MSTFLTPAGQYDRSAIMRRVWDCVGGRIRSNPLAPLAWKRNLIAHQLRRAWAEAHREMGMLRLQQTEAAAEAGRRAAAAAIPAEIRVARVDVLRTELRALDLSDDCGRASIRTREIYRELTSLAA